MAVQYFLTALDHEGNSLAFAGNSHYPRLVKYKADNPEISLFSDWFDAVYALGKVIEDAHDGANYKLYDLHRNKQYYEGLLISPLHKIDNERTDSEEFADVRFLLESIRLKNQMSPQYLLPPPIIK